MGKCIYDTVNMLYIMCITVNINILLIIFNTIRSYLHIKHVSLNLFSKNKFEFKKNN